MTIWLGENLSEVMDNAAGDSIARQNLQQLRLHQEMQGAVGACLTRVADASDKRMYRTEDEAFEAVLLNGRNLKYVPTDSRWPELCELAVVQTGFALEWVPLALKTEELCLLAVQGVGYALIWVPERHRTFDVCRAALMSGQSTSNHPSPDWEDDISELMKYIPVQFHWLQAALIDGNSFTVHCNLETWDVWVTDIGGITLTTIQASPQQTLGKLLEELQADLKEQDYNFQNKFMGEDGRSLELWSKEDLLVNVMPAIVSKLLLHLSDGEPLV